ncbi:MAG: NAD-dependent epimerase/dehydratase family protein [Spongiibacteraceae bacterium]|nr:NAD-dependent epimerase/dehydratase family protein [Spongiibacteraceae bacterium]
MRAVITGAGGFVGRALSKELLCNGYESLVLVDSHLNSEAYAQEPRVSCIEGQLQDASVRERALATGFDQLFHLAALPGGAAEADPALSKAVNLDATLALIEHASRMEKCPRLVFTSTIAVLGAPMPSVVDDTSPIVPAMTYGTHKAMIELALADLSRRALIDSVAVRLPGIVARPAGPSGLKSAFMSNVFHALKAGEPFVSPVSSQATMWLMSVDRCAKNLRHAANLDTKTLPASRALTLPALRVSMKELVAAIAMISGSDEALVSYEPDDNLEANFGQQPPLVTQVGDSAGFVHDKNLLALVRSVFSAE